MRGLLRLLKWCPWCTVPKVVAKQPEEFSGDLLPRNLEVGEDRDDPEEGQASRSQLVFFETVGPLLKMNKDKTCGSSLGGGALVKCQWGRDNCAFIFVGGHTRNSNWVNTGKDFVIFAPLIE